MKAKVARAQVFVRLDPWRQVGGQVAGVFAEPELEYGVGAIPSDVRHESKSVGPVGLHRVGASGRFQPFDGWASYRSVIPDRMYRRMRALIIGGQHKPALAVCGQKCGCGLQRYLPILAQPSGVLVYPEAGYF